ncbi:helix-turn-helix transcriptional regulator [Nonomuraea typhae]|uniref:helix-turn-helix transcriptional regulator n=1 Tax=Nonomuraea typhae TaxID=2603600 RepID=UPI0012F7FFE8|nr:helix-turn-helix transcriptional regulator [Nonomuraea typhae]
MNELGEFLKSRRARVRPEETGLRSYGGRRRVPGLRREELAQLAGMSADYYTRLEQGRGGGVSEEVLNALARTLGLDQDERTYLFSLARPVRAPRRTRRTVGPELRHLLDAMEGVPAYVIDHRGEVLAWNRLAAALYADLGRHRNWARFCFLDEASKEVFVDWEKKAREVVAYLRLKAAQHPDDARLAALVGELSVKSADFRRWWADHNVREKTRGTKQIRHPVAGELALSFQSFTVAGEPDQVLVAYAAEPGSPSQEALRLLASWSLPDLQNAP